MVLSKKDKKGFGIEDAGMLLYRLIFLALAIFVFVLFASMLLNPFPNINSPKAELLTARILYSEAIHYKEFIPTSNINIVHTNIIDLDKLVSLKYKIFLDELNSKTQQQIIYFIQNPENKEYLEDDSALKEYLFDEFYNPTRNNLLVFNLTVTLQNNPANTVMFPDLGKEFVVPINYLINSNKNITSDYNSSSSNFSLAGFKNSNVPILIFQSSNKNTIEMNFINNLEEYIMMYPKRKSEGKGAISEIIKKYKSSCKLFNKLVPCEIKLSVLMPNS